MLIQTHSNPDKIEILYFNIWYLVIGIAQKFGNPNRFLYALLTTSLFTQTCCIKNIFIFTGLRTIFPLFMKTPKKNRKRVLSSEEHEEHVSSIIASMLRNCRGSQRQRLVSKFTENDHEKVDRLLELHFKYLDKVELLDATLDDNVEDEDSSYLKRLEGGLFTLQLVDYIIVEVCAAGPNSIKQRVMQILNLRGASLKTIRHVMREYAGNLGDEGDQEWRDQEQQHILHLVDKF